MKVTKKDYQKLTSFLKKQKLENHIKGFALVGGLAVSSHCEPRATKDVDFLVDYQEGFSPDLLVRAFADQGYQLKIAKGGLKDPFHGLIRIYDDEGIEMFDLIPVHWKWQQEVINNALLVEVFDTIETPIARIEDLIVMKLKAGGPQDMLDAENLLQAAGAAGKLALEQMMDLAKRAGVDKKLGRLLKK